MSSDKEAALIEFPGDSADVFMWKPFDMTSIPREIVEHCLNIKADAMPVQQRLCRFDKEKCKAIGEELARL